MVRKFSQLVKGMDVIRAAGHEQSVTLKHSERLFVISEKLEPAIVCDGVIAMELNGKTQGPCR
jgi:hypothetical protein